MKCLNPDLCQAIGFLAPKLVGDNDVGVNLLVLVVVFIAMGFLRSSVVLVTVLIVIFRTLVVRLQRHDVVVFFPGPRLPAT